LFNPRKNKINLLSFWKFSPRHAETAVCFQWKDKSASFVYRNLRCLFEEPHRTRK